MSKVIYTCITNGKDVLNEDINAEGARLVCFTNDDIKSDKWEIIKIPELFTDPRRNSRIVKILPHIYFPEAEYSLYLDGNISLKVPIQTLIDEWLGVVYEIAFFKHPTRDCYFEEAKEVIRLGLDDKETVVQQCIAYNAMPRHWGLFQGGVILRKHNIPVEGFNEMWWSLYCTGSKRDQISLPIALKDGGLLVKGINGGAWQHLYFQMVNHKVPSEWANKI